MALSIALIEKAELRRNPIAVSCFNKLYAPARWCEENSETCGKLFQWEMNLIAAAFGEERDKSPRKKYSLFRDPNVWVVWRMGQGGTHFVVRDWLSREDAERLVETCTASHPDQTYWAESRE
jgi:hypothetical protein